MEIVHELNQLDFGGVERVIRNIIKFDKKNKYTVACYKDGAYREELEKVGAKIVILGQDEVDLAADVIHIHSGGARSNMAAHLNKSFPIIETIHSPVRSAVMNNEVHQRVGVCETVSELNRNAITIKNGLDFDQLQVTKTATEIKKELGIPEDKPVIGRLGRLGRDKGLEEWILTCYQLQKGGLDFVPLIVGDEARNDEGYRGGLKLMCESLPLKNVVWAGHRTDIANLYEVMNVFLYPSPTEGFGLVFAEAMYCGVPVVTYETPVTHELFAGYALFSDKNIRSLKHNVLRALSTNYSDELIPLAMEWVKSEYQAERMSQQYQELYEQSNFDPNTHRESKETHVVLT